MSPRFLDVRPLRLRLKSPFRISGYVFEATDAIVATISGDGHVGRGEAAGVYYTGDGLDHMLEEIESARAEIEKGADRMALQALLPPGGARNALDCALWEYEASQREAPVWQLAGISEPKPVVTTFTVGAEPAEQAVASTFDFPDPKAIKIKLSGEAEPDLERVKAIRAARPDAWIGVDANQGYHRADLDGLVQALAGQNVSLLEQPLPRGAEAELDGYKSRIPIAADESILSLAELPKAAGRFDVINIKLDKCGGLTEGLAIAAEARRMGLGVMVGNMVGTSLAMAPAFVLAQLCDFVDLDGPTFLAEDVRPAVAYRHGEIWCGEDVWGGRARTRCGLTNMAGRSEGSSAHRAAGGQAEVTWFGQPSGLTVLFLTNMWEQFSYYGMRALLVYYMTRELLIGQQTSSFIYGTYTAFAYFTPIVGGTIADRWLGKRRAVTIGAIVMAAGHFMMAFHPAFYFALATIALGNGLFLPTLPSQINDLYAADDPRRAWAYNVYYVGVNIGGFLAPLVCGTLGELYGWHWGFGAAGVGMLLGLLIYLTGRRHLPAERARTIAPAEEAKAAGTRGTITLLLGVGLAVTLFRGAYEQVGNTVALWAGSGVNRAAGSFLIPMTWFQALNPLLVMLMTPFLLARWKRKAAAGREHSVLQKMAMGAAIVASSYVLLAVAAAVASDRSASWLWLAGFFLILTLGELYILPNGLGLFARLAPPRFGATTVAAWYLATFAGSLFAGLVGGLWSSFSRPAFFLLLAFLASGATLFLLLLDRHARAVLTSHAGATVLQAEPPAPAVVD